MLLDGYWKKELKHNIKILKFGIKLSGKFTQYAEHQINKSILYSAIIIRKMFEDEKGAETYISKKKSIPMPPLKLLKYKVKVTAYPFSGNKDFIINRVIPNNYNHENAIEEQIELNKLCNQIIHSYLWSVVYERETFKICEVLFASDKAKSDVLYSLNLKEFIKAVEFCVENGTI